MRQDAELVQDRARGIADAKLTIDDSVWRDLSERVDAALLDHELTHLQVVVKATEHGAVVAKDDLGGRS